MDIPLWAFQESPPDPRTGEWSNAANRRTSNTCEWMLPATGHPLPWAGDTQRPRCRCGRGSNAGRERWPGLCGSRMAR